MSTSNPEQYHPDSVQRYEWIFGANLLGSGGTDSIDFCVDGLPLGPESHVLDVGSGLGGGAFHIASRYGADVVGVDILESMVCEATKRAERLGLSHVRFVAGDIIDVDFPEASFDLVYSRDALLHVSDKPALFRRLRALLKPGAWIAFTDYARGVASGSETFESYVRESDYSLLLPDSYAEVLRATGFENVRVDDATERFRGFLGRELDRIGESIQAGSTGLSPHDLEYLRDRWALKLACCTRGEMKWCRLRGIRPPSG